MSFMDSYKRLDNLCKTFPIIPKAFHPISKSWSVVFKHGISALAGHLIMTA